MLELDHLHKSFGSRTVLSDVSHAFAPGRFVAIMGESGVGKSTLLNLIAGLDVPDSGRILIDGQVMQALDDERATLLRRTRMGFVFQAFHVLPHLTLHQNVALPLLLNHAQQERAEAMLEAVGLGGRGADFPAQLSGGELQRVAIARALAHRPALLLADEPTGNLDPETASVILDLIRRETRAHGAGVIMVTHSHAAAAMADEVYMLSRTGLRRT